MHPKDHIKVLGVILDSRLKYREHIARAASKGLNAAMELKRLKGLSAATSRQLFTATVAPVVDYASNVWMHACRKKLAGPVNRIQKAGAQAIVGTFFSAATSVVEAEAHIPSVHERHWRRAIKLWIDIHTLPDTNPLRRATDRIQRFYPAHRSPFHQVSRRMKDLSLNEIETIEPFALTPWDERVSTLSDDSVEGKAPAGWNIRLAVSSSARNGVVGVGGAMQGPLATQERTTQLTFSFTIGPRTEQSPYSGQLAAIEYGLRRLPPTRNRMVVVTTNSKAVMLTLKNPKRKSGQEHVKHIYENIARLRERGNKVLIVWTPACTENGLISRAKHEAREASREGTAPRGRFPMMLSTVSNMERRKLRGERCIAENVGEYSKAVDAALPGKHTRQLYDKLSWEERSALAQLRTDMSKLNNSLYRIKATASDICACGRERETVAHFLFRCNRWAQHRTEMLNCTDTKRGNTSFFLGGKEPSDKSNWEPDMKAVQATIRFVTATGRFSKSA